MGDHSRRLIVCVLALTLGTCSSIIEGTSQEISVNTNPAGADCSLERQGVSIAHVNPTPGSATIKKTKYDITIVCKKPGFEDATYLNHSGAAGATFGNIVLGGGIGWAIDSASGADNKYDSPVNVTLVPSFASSSQPPGNTATQIPGSAPTQAPGSAEDKIRTLKDLRDRHLITPEEYETRRKEILDAL